MLCFVQCFVIYVGFCSQVTRCPADPAEWKQTFQIYPVGINESLVIDLEMICDCACENPESTVSTLMSDVFSFFF